MNSATTAELTCVIVQVQGGVHNELCNYSRADLCYCPGPGRCTL